MRLMRVVPLLFLVGCTSVAPPIPPPPTLPSPPPLKTKSIDLCATVSCAPRDSSDIRIDQGKLMSGDKALTPEFLAIDSFAVSNERKEVVFSAKRKDNFDVGLVSIDGSDVHWLPEEPSDEVGVAWAPRGNKVSYIVRTKTGDVVRTVHVPTAVQVVAGFPYARVRSLGWDAGAERYFVNVTSPEASERIESMKYDGSSRQTITAPEVKLDAEVEPFAGGILVRPTLLKYNERVPLVVWIDSEPLRWSDSRGELMRHNKVAVAVLTREPDDAFWKEVAATPWIDPANLYGVWGPDSAGRYAADGKVTERGIVESSASGWISQQLKARNGVR